MSEGLNKFGVFTGPNEVTRTFKQPRMKHRFRVGFIGFGNGNFENITLEAISCTLPKISFDGVDVHGYNSKAHFVGKPSWDPVDLVVRDAFDNSVIKEFSAQLQKQFDVHEQVSATVAVNYKFEMLIELLDGHGASTLTWHGYGGDILNLNFGELDYSTSDANTISSTIRCDNWLIFDEAGNNVTQGGNVSTFLSKVGLL